MSAKAIFYEKSSPGMGREDERDDKTPEVGTKCEFQAFDHIPMLYTAQALPRDGRV